MERGKKTRQQRPIKPLARALIRWFGAEARPLPWRRTTDPYAIWVAEIMLQQTQVKTVIPYWERWMRALPDIRALAKASPQTVLKLWEGLGYYSRARNLHRAAQMLVTRDNGRFPEQFEEVLGLPGVGRYTAGAICSIAFNRPTPVLDGNVMRVLTRLFAIGANARAAKTNARLWELSEQLVRSAASLPSPRPGDEQGRVNSAFGAHQPGNCSLLNQALMELGAVICTPRQTQCARCPARRFCLARKLDRASEFPNLGPRQATIFRRMAAVVVEHRGRVLVRQRPAGVLNGHLWELPNAEWDEGVSLEETLKQAIRVEGISWVMNKNNNLVKEYSKKGILIPLCTIRHPVTRYRIHLEAYYLKAIYLFATATDGERWVTWAELKRLPFASAHRKVLECVKRYSASPCFCRWASKRSMVASKSSQ